MKRNFAALAAGLFVVGIVCSGWFLAYKVGAVKYFPFAETDPDIPLFGKGKGGISKEEFMLERAQYIGQKRGLQKDKPLPDPQLRVEAIGQMERQQAAVAARADSAEKEQLLAAWIPIGPAPIPNGQTSTTVTPVSGRTTAIAVDPTDANTVYVGTAQGGLYRSLNGGTTWTPLLDNALSLSIGAIAIAPSQPSTIYVGTGEPNFSVDSFFGVGVYRIDNANTVSPTVSAALGANVFTGASISQIAVDAANPANIFVATVFGLGGISGNFPATVPPFGVYRSTDATAAAPTFTKLDVIPGASNQLGYTGVVIDPGDANRVICVTGDLFGNIGAAQRGIYLSTNALAANPTFTLTQALNTTNRTELAINRVGATTTVFAATALSNGRLYRSTTGGASFTQQIDNNFCGGQCFYDVAVAVDPTNANNVYLGGDPSFVFGFSTNGGTAFTESENGLHADTHALAVAPSAPATIYLGTDGGIYKSTNSGATWQVLNNTDFSATQFMGLSVHPTDPNFTLGGTQDNGTNLLQANGVWRRADFGDGGYSVIDQNAPDTTNVTMYHTYFNQTNAMGYARALNTAQASDNLWTFYGCGFTGSIPNGMTCAASDILFYAPMEQGPGTPNTLYFGSDVLYRSDNLGVTMTKVSQEPIVSGAAISAIGISTQNDNVRIVGLVNGGIYGTGTTPGTTTLQNLDPTNIVPNEFIARAVILPNIPTKAYVTLSAFGVTNVWKTTNLNGFAEGGDAPAAPTWTAAAGSGGTALPQVPVSAFVIDPLNANTVYAGTDIGVYVSLDAGATWNPFGTGLPRVAVFDMAIVPGASPRQLRIATHGRGMFQIPAAEPTAASVTVSGRVFAGKGRGLANARVTLTDQSGNSRTVITSPFGYYRFTEIEAGQSCVFQVTSKRYRFAPRVVTVSEDLDELNFFAEP